MPISFLNSTKKHIRNNLVLYFLVALCFFIGISVGAFTIKVINPEDKIQLITYLKGYFKLFDGTNINNSDVFIISLKDNLKLLSMDWLLGILVIGLPGILLVVGVKGFVIGFILGLLVSELRFKGILLFLFGILPQNIIIVPIFFYASTLSICFTLSIIKNKLNKSVKFEFRKALFIYTMSYCILALLLIIGVFIEAFISTNFIKFLNSYI